MAERRTPGEDVGDLDVLADDVPRGLDAVAAHVQERPAARRLGIPEVRCVRTGVTLAGAHREDPAEGTGGDHLADLDDIRAEDLVLEVAVEESCLLDETEHLGGLFGVPPERLGAQDALAGRDRGADRLEMEVVGQRDDDEVDVRVGAQAGDRVVRALDAVATGEVGPASATGGGAGHDPRPGHEPQPRYVVVGDEAGTDHPETDITRHQ